MVDSCTITLRRPSASCVARRRDRYAWVQPLDISSCTGTRSASSYPRGKGRRQPREPRRPARAIVGERHVLERDASCSCTSPTACPDTGASRRWRLSRQHATRRSHVVRALAAVSVSFVARGAGTGLSGGALADDVVLLGLHRLKRIIDIDPRQAARVGRAWRRERGAQSSTSRRTECSTRPDPSSDAACTIGGNVAENAGGPHCLKYGVTLNHILAATVVLPDGDVVELGDADGEHARARSPRRVRRIRRMLRRRARRDGAADAQAAVRSARCSPTFKTVEDAARATSAIIASGIVPAALEFMDQATIQASWKSRSMPPDILPMRQRYCSSKWTAVRRRWTRTSTRVRELCARLRRHATCVVARDDARANAALAGTQESVRRDGPHRAAPRRAGRGDPAHEAPGDSRVRSARSATRTA